MYPSSRSNLTSLYLCERDGGLSARYNQCHFDFGRIFTIGESCNSSINLNCRIPVAVRRPAFILHGANPLTSTTVVRCAPRLARKLAVKHCQLRKNGQLCLPQGTYNLFSFAESSKKNLVGEWLRFETVLQQG